MIEIFISSTLGVVVHVHAKDGAKGLLTVVQTSAHKVSNSRYQS